DGDGRLVNIEGSPGKVVVEPAKDRLVRGLYGSHEMTGVKRGEPVPLHPRCRSMYDLLGGSPGKNDLAPLQEDFAELRYKINVGKSTIDMMVFDTTARAAFLSRGPSYKVSWHKFEFPAKK